MMECSNIHYFEFGFQHYKIMNCYYLCCIYFFEPLMLFTVTLNKEHFSTYRSLRHIQTGRFLAVSEQNLVPDVSGKLENTFQAFLDGLRSNYGLKLQFICVTLSFSAHLSVMHMYMCLIYSKPYQNVFCRSDYGKNEWRSVDIKIILKWL